MSRPLASNVALPISVTSVEAGGTSVTLAGLAAKPTLVLEDGRGK